jgi:LPXTG-site transpeptidase (sortase) family protein
MFTPQQKNWFLTGGLILVIFTITYTTLLIFGLTPKQFQSSDGQLNIFQVKDSTPSDFDVVQEPLDSNLIPEKISIPKIDVDSIIQVPRAVDVATLDAALEKGAVYYPGSGTLQGGNMFLFGHSTNWRVVNNQAYQTFNNLDKLIPGDEIILTSGDTQYVYKVQTVVRASEDDTLIEFNKGARMLTISTCDTFGRKQDRWVVEAVFEKTI